MPLPFQVQLPKCFTKLNYELKQENFKKLPDKTLIYIFYNNENRAFQHEAVTILYQREWMYNFEEYVWFLKPVFSGNETMNQFFNIKKWEVAPYQFQIRKDQFARLEDFDTYSKIKEGSNSPRGNSQS